MLTYLPLGDSYTIGEGASEAESWPTLLTEHLIRGGIEVKLLGNPARTGWTSKDLIENELPEFHRLRPSFCSLLIGVNDWVQGFSVTDFMGNVRKILDTLSKAPQPPKIFMVTIPDFSVTPKGPTYSRGRDIAKGLSEFNRALIEEATLRGIPVADIFPLSQHMKNDPSQIADDGLHPSAKAYALWERTIFPVAIELLHT